MGLASATLPSEVERAGHCRPSSDRAMPAFFCGTPLLTSDEERRLFSQIRSASRRIDILRERLQRPAANTSAIDELRNRRRDVKRLRNRIVAANLRLLVSIAGRFATPDWQLADIVSDGTLPLLRAAELFDPGRGYRFSTYASRAIWNRLSRINRKRAARCRREMSMPSTFLDSVAIAGNGSHDDQFRQHLQYRRLEREIARTLSDRERLLISARFGLGKFSRGHTFREIAPLAGLSRERVRVLTHRALQKLRENLVGRKDNVKSPA